MNQFSYWHASITIKTIKVCLYQLPPSDQRWHTAAGFASGGSFVGGVGVMEVILFSGVSGNFLYRPIGEIPLGYSIK